MNLDEAIKVLNQWIMTGKTHTPTSEKAFDVVQREVNTFEWSFSQDEVEDIRAQVMYSIAKRSTPLKITTNTQGYIWTIFENLCINHYKRKQKRGEGSTTRADNSSRDLEDSTQTPERLLSVEQIDPDTSNSVRNQVLDTLKEAYKQTCSEKKWPKELEHINDYYDFIFNDLKSRDIVLEKHGKTLSEQALEIEINNLDQNRRRFKKRLIKWFEEHSQKMDSDTYKQVQAILVVMKIIDDA